MSGFTARIQGWLVLVVVVAACAQLLEAQPVANDRASDTTAILLASARYVRRVMKRDTLFLERSFICVDAPAPRCRFALQASLIGLSAPAIRGDSARVIVYDFNPGDMNGSQPGSFSTAFLELHLVRSRGTWRVKRGRSAAA